MLGKEMILKLYDYTCQANGRILEVAAKVSESDLVAANEYGHGSLYDLIFHTMQVEWVWRNLSQNGRVDRKQLPQKEAFRAISDFEKWWGQEQATMHGYLEQLNEEELASAVLVTRWDGSVSNLIRWQMLSHMMFHSMQHRSEAAVLLTKYNQSPGDLDFIFFV